MVTDRFDTPHGTCLILGDTGGTGSPHALGRAAVRAALAQPDAEIPSDDRGAPVLPAGWLGSISHKVGRAAALVARDDGSGARIGVDLERAAAPRQPIARRILVARELARLTDRRDVSLCFAIKEAIYKAIDPIVRRYVGFTEVEVEIDAGGGCTITLVEPANLPVVVEAAWQERDGYWLATARARRKTS